MRWGLVELSHRIIHKPWAPTKRKSSPTDFGGRFEVLPDDGELAPSLLQIDRCLFRLSLGNLTSSMSLTSIPCSCGLKAELLNKGQVVKKVQLPPKGRASPREKREASLLSWRPLPHCLKIRNDWPFISPCSCLPLWTSLGPCQHSHTCCLEPINVYLLCERLKEKERRYWRPHYRRWTKKGGPLCG